MTSSIPPERIDLGEFSPITQRIASSRLDLPQPLGPTTPVSPGSICKVAGSTKLLKPLNRSFEMRIVVLSPRRRTYLAPARWRMGSSAAQVLASTSRPFSLKVGVPEMLYSWL